MCTAPHPRKHAEGFAEGGSFVADMKLNYSVRAWKKTHEEPIAVEEKVLLRTRNATLTRRAVANSKPRRAKQPAYFAEALRKLRERMAPCLQASRIMGSPIELKPAQAAAEHYLT